MKYKTPQVRRNYLYIAIILFIIAIVYGIFVHSPQRMRGIITLKGETLAGEP